MKDKNRAIPVVLLAILWAALYAGARWLSPFSPTVLTWDPVRFLPVVTAFVVPYVSFFLMPLLFAWFMPDDAVLMNRAIRATSAIIVVSALVFFFLPTEMIRPALDPAASWAAWLLDLIRHVDTPRNCFPSLHVSLAVFFGLGIGHLRPRWYAPTLAWVAVIALSTVLTRQHYVADVLGGLVLGGLGWLYFIRK